jgi:TolA-binding protein
MLKEFLKPVYGCLFILFLIPDSGFAQRTLVYEDVSRIYQRGLELFDKEKYGVAQKHFLMYAERSKDRETKANAEYYAGVCAMELFNPDAINLLNSVRRKYPEHAKANLATYQLGRYFYRSKDNKNAVRYLDQVDASALTPGELAEFWFIKGYVLFKTEKFDEAKQAFANVKDQPSKYYDPVNYYYGYVAYKQGNYDEALEHFNRINKSKTFGPLSQVYVSQILFARKQYSQVVSFADTISNREILNDVAGIVGQSHYNLGNYEKALPYLERFTANHPNGRSTQDLYRLGFAYLKSGDCAKAIDQFVQVTDGKDTTAQYASYHIAGCYVQMPDKKPAARLAYEKAANLKFDPRVTEISLYNYAKLSYELGFQQVALSSLASFVNAYPNSEYSDEARSNLSDLLLSTRNYKEAIRIIESIKNPNRETQIAFQRVCYYRGEELYLGNDHAGAMQMFKKSLQFDLDKKLHALAWFWLGELNYKQMQYQEALDAYTKFHAQEEGKDTRFYPLAWYNKGYCHLKMDEYSAAIAEFSHFVSSDYARTAPEIYTDASMRIADCYFVKGDYSKAIESYSVVIDKKLNGTDYALYQKAMIMGVEGRPSDKISNLEQIRSNHPRSAYIDDAVYEIANVNLQTENYDKAIEGFQDLIENYPRSIYIRKAMLNKGLSYYNTSRDEKALAEFKSLITSYPGSDESRQALVVIRNIFVNKGESEAYLEFIKVLPNVVVSPTYQDSVTYESAFNLYKNGDCVKASKAFGNYISKFPGGFFILRSNYYKAECDFKNKSYNEALVNYEFVATYNRNDFTERATRQTAVLYYMNKNYEKAFEFYSALERIAGSGDNLSVALLGQIRTSALLNKVDTAAAASFRYLNSANPQKEGMIEARMSIGRYYMNRNMPDSALPAFQYVIKETKSALAAESKYNIALIQFLKKENKAAMKSVFELNEKYSNNEYWIAKGFILLADMYTADKDYFQAKATLQSIIDNYEGEDLRAVARAKLSSVIAEEEKTRPAPAPEPQKETE